MAWLGVLFALLVGYEIAVDLGPTASLLIQISGWTIWALFVIEFVAELRVAPNRRQFLRRRWLQLVALLLPTLRLLSFVRLIRLGRALPAARALTSSSRTVGTARRVFRSRLGYLAAVSVIAGVALAEVAFVFERDANGIFSSFGDALIWSFAVVLALQGDPVPTTTVARVAMLVGFAFGLVVVASLAGSIGAFLVERRSEGGDA